MRFGTAAGPSPAEPKTQELLFRGDGLELRIPFREVKAVTARSGSREVSFGTGRASFALGPAAEKWALKIRYPRGLLICLGIASKADRARLARLKPSLKPNGGIWTVWTKGQKTLTENDVRAAALAELVDVKVVSVSATLSGLKLVIPLAKR